MQGTCFAWHDISDKVSKSAASIYMEEKAQQAERGVGGWRRLRSRMPWDSKSSDVSPKAAPREGSPMHLHTGLLPLLLKDTAFKRNGRTTRLPHSLCLERMPRNRNKPQNRRLCPLWPRSTLCGKRSPWLAAGESLNKTPAYHCY